MRAEGAQIGGRMRIQYLGHSCFKIESEGFSVILDPYEKGSVPGLRDLDEEANLCLCSHEHGDHNGRDCVKITDAGKRNPFEIERLYSWHDDAQGALRGSNIIHILHAEGRSIVHLGDLGCMPETEQIENMRGADVVLVPAGGHYTAPPEKMARLISLLAPKTVIPMHYRTKESGFDEIAPCERFIEVCGRGAIYSDSDTLELAGQEVPQLIVLHQQAAGA